MAGVLSDAHKNGGLTQFSHARILSEIGLFVQLFTNAGGVYLSFV